VSLHFGSTPTSISKAIALVLYNTITTISRAYPFKGKVEGGRGQLFNIAFLTVFPLQTSPVVNEGVNGGGNEVSDTTRTLSLTYEIFSVYSRLIKEEIR
jgi:hypothetical protein